MEYVAFFLVPEIGQPSFIQSMICEGTYDNITQTIYITYTNKSLLA